MTRIRNNGKPDRRYGAKGSQPQRWQAGPDPWLRQLRRRFVLARNQARYWAQEWSLTWAQYLQHHHSVLPHQLGRQHTGLCLARRDITQGWHDHNVAMVTRSAMARQGKSKNRERQRRRQAMVQARQPGAQHDESQ